MQGFVKIVDWLILALGILAGAAVVMMMVHVTANVIMIYVFRQPIPGTLAIVANYYMPLITFLPLAFVERIENHVSVEVLTQFFPLRAQNHLYGWIYVFGLIVCALLAYATWIEALDRFEVRSFRIERGVRVPTWPVRFAAPISYGMLSILFGLKFVAYLFRSSTVARTPHRLGYFHDEIGGSK